MSPPSSDAVRTGPDGLVIVAKSPGMTSHDVVARVRRIAHTRKVGHAGTLDPMATGVLVLGVGRATRLLTYLTGADKVYQATVRLGQATVTDDAEGEVTATVSAGQLTEEAVRRQFAALTGEVDQVPSAVSAIKIDGVRSYRRVRRGESVELPARRVTISRIDVLNITRGAVHDSEVVDVEIEVACSSGTYVRAIARDAGDGLRVGGHLTALRRTRVGPFVLGEAHSLDRLAELANPVTLPLPVALRRILPVREVDHEQAGRLAHGSPLPPSGQPGPYGVLGPDGAALAVVSERDGLARPEIVLA